MKMKARSKVMMTIQFVSIEIRKETGKNAYQTQPMYTLMQNYVY